MGIFVFGSADNRSAAPHAAATTATQPKQTAATANSAATVKIIEETQQT
jgi:hypothetical protein